MGTRVFLIGFMGSGKSTLGSKLARKLGYGFVDMDHLIEDTAGMTVPEIFGEHGEAVFRKWEHDILMELIQQKQLVISTGGGAPCHGEMMRIMNDHGVTLYLKLPPTALRDRLIHSKTERPLIQGKSEEDLLHFITTLLNERESFYGQAQIIADGVNPNLPRLVELIQQEG